MPVYNVAVELTLTGAIADALAVVAARFVGLNTAALEVGKSIQGWGTALRGVATALGGAGILGAFKEISEHYNKMADAIGRMGLQGADPSALKSASEWAAIVARRVGVKQEAAMTELNALSYYTADQNIAKRLLDPVLRMGIVLRSAGGQTLGTNQITPIMKLMEETGLLTDPTRQADLDKVLERLTKSMAAAASGPGNKVITPLMLQQAGVYMRAARYGITTPEALAMEHPFLTDILPFYAQMAGGQAQTGGGAGLMSMFTKTVQGTLSKKSIAEAGRLGLLEGGHIKGEHLANINPYEWVQQFLVPALKEQGLTDPKTQTTEIISLLSRLFGTRLAADPAIQFALQGRAYKGVEESPYERHIARMEKGLGIETGSRFAQENMPSEAIARLKAQWDSVLVDIAKGLNPSYMTWVKQITEFIEKLDQAIIKIDPATIGKVGDAMVQLGIGLTALGGTAVLAAIASLIGPGGLAAFALAMTGFSEKVQKAVTEFIQALSTADTKKIEEAGAKLALTAAGALVTGLIQASDYVVDKLKEAAAGALARIQGLFGGQGTPFHDTHPFFKRGVPDTSQKHLFGGPRSWEHMPPASGGAHKASWEPSGGGTDKQLQVNNVIYLDGSAIARAVHDYLIAGVEHPKQAPYFDGRDGYTSPDHQPITT